MEPTAVPAPPPASSANPALRDAARLVESMGPVAWTRGKDSLADEIGEVAEVLGLSPAQKSALQEAAARARGEVLAAAANSARVKFNENAVARDPESPEERQARMVAMNSNPTPAEMVRMYTEQLSRASAAVPERELVVELGGSPEAVEAVSKMQAAFAEIMGADAFALFRSAGGQAMVQTYFNDIGLLPYALVINSRAAGTLSQSQQASLASRARIEAQTGRASVVPRFADDGLGDGRRYDVRTIRLSQGGGFNRPSSDPLGRGGGGGMSLSRVNPGGGVGYSGAPTVGIDDLKAMLAPMNVTVPAGF